MTGERRPRLDDARASVADAHHCLQVCDQAVVSQRGLECPLLGSRSFSVISGQVRCIVHTSQSYLQDLWCLPLRRFTLLRCLHEPRPLQVQCHRGVWISRYLSAPQALPSHISPSALDGLQLIILPYHRQLLLRASRSLSPLHSTRAAADPTAPAANSICRTSSQSSGLTRAWGSVPVTSSGVSPPDKRAFTSAPRQRSSWTAIAFP